MAPTSDDIRYVKLVLLLVKGGTFVAKRFLLNNLDKSVDDYLKDNENKLDFARKKTQITETQMNILFPGTRTDLNCWDISLYSYILLNLFDDKLELDEKIAIAELRNKRNELAHSGSYTLSEVQFTGTWTSLMTVLFQLARKLTTAEREEINAIVQELSAIHDFQFATTELNSLTCHEDFVHDALPEMMKSIDQQLKKLVRRLENLEVLQERQHEIKARIVSVPTQTVMKTAQTELLNATQRSVSRKQDQADNQDQTDQHDLTCDDDVFMASDNLFSDMRDQGADVVKVEEGSILVTFRCSTISALKNICKYLADKMYAERLAELENALSKYVGSPVTLNIYLVLETLHSALKKIDTYQMETGASDTYQMETSASDTYQMETSASARQKVQIMNPMQTKFCHDFALALKKMTNDFDCKYPEDNDELDDNVPLIVVCPKLTRLKPDVDLAIESLQRSSPYVVIILHIGSERNLPALPSKQKLREYRNITFIDMGFNDKGAIFECRHNTEATIQLRHYIDTYLPESSRPESTENRESSRATPKPTPFPKLLSDKPWRQLSQSGKELEESLMKDIKELKPMRIPLVQLFGPVGAGKSSFINACLSVSAGRKKASAQTGSAATSYTLKFRYYTDIGLLKNFRLIDCMGFEPTYGQGFHPNDLFYLLQGHVKKNYQFDPEKPINPQSKFYRKKPKFEYKTHCVVFVLDARTIHGGIPEAYIDKIQLLQDEINRADVPRVLILTHIDMFCDEVKEDASNIFRSLKVENAMQMASEVFSIEMASIHPVINYEEDVELSTAKSIPILLALRQIMQYACDRVEYVLNDSENSEESDSD